MNKEEKGKAESKWHELRNTLPSGIELVGEYIHAWGTKYNGSESSDSFYDWWSQFKDTIRWYVEETDTIVARRRWYIKNYTSRIQRSEPSCKYQ